MATMRMEGLVGQTLGAYRVVEQIGRGGMATVYKAYEPALDRYVAIKVLPQYFVHDPEFVARFEREAKAVAKLNHPNILPIYSFGQEAGLTYIAMRYVKAGTLKEMLGQPLDLKTTADILGQVGRALDYAHRQGMVHRDVKPTNVLMAEGKWALLTDFGLARMVESSVRITKTGVGVGTPAYMSPEQGQGTKVDVRSDVYSLGVVLYEMVTGRVPYEAETPLAVVLKHITAPLPLPRSVNPDLPEAVERVILKAMAKAPEDRYQTAKEMLEALEKAVAGMPVVQVIESPPEVRPVPVEEVPAAVAAGPTPAPAVTVPLEAPPAARKRLPVWVWGVIGVVVLLIAAGGVFLATRGKKPSTRDVASTMYDDFNDPAHEGSYDEGLWKLGADPDQVAQHNGVMVFTQQGEPFEAAALFAREYSAISIDRPAFLEAKLMLSPDANAGNVHLDLRTALSPDEEWWYAECLVVNNPEGEAEVGCFDEVIHHRQVKRHYDAGSIPVPFGSWHTVRMEVDPATMTFSYFVDEECVGSHTPLDADRLREARFTASIGIYSLSAGALTGHVDDVRIGPVEALASTSIPPAQPERSRLVERCEGVMPHQICIRDAETGRVIQVTDNLDFGGVGRFAWSPDGQQIIFDAGSDYEVTRQYEHNLYVINADGSDLRQVTSGDTNDVMPSWSPDGEWIAFHRNCDLWIVHPDGSDARRLLEGSELFCAEMIVWSPDSWHIALLNMSDGVSAEVWIVNRDGTDPYVVHSFERPQEPWEVAWGPGGRQIACRYGEDGKPKLSLINADGSGEPQVIEEGDELLELVRSWFPDFWPQWEEGPVPVEGVFYDDFEGEVLDPARWEPGGDADRNVVFLQDGRLRFEVDNDLSRAWDGHLVARLSAPVRSIAFSIGLDEAMGESFGFGVLLMDRRQEKSVLLNAAGDILVGEMGQVREVRRARHPPPAQHYILLNWEGERVVIYADDELIGKMDVPGFAGGVAFWCHLEPGGKIVGYVDDVRLEYAEEGEVFAPLSKPIPPAQPEAGKLVNHCEGVTPHQICIRDAETGRVIQVTDNLDFGAIGGYAWSPDGQQIIFDAGSDFEATGRHDHRLYIVNADGSDLRQVTSGDTNDIMPAWSPDGRWIAFHRSCDLSLIRPDGSDARGLLEGPAPFCAINMVWSPDSQRVAFLNISDEPALREVWVINHDGTDPHVVHSFERLEYGEVAWSPDGRQIACWYRDGDRWEGLLINADGRGEPKVLDREDSTLRSWLPDFWPQWGR